MRRFVFTIFIATALNFSAAAQSALSIVPPNAAGVFGIEWRRILESPAGTALKVQLDKPELAQMAAFKDTVLNKLDSVVIATPAIAVKSGTQPPVLIVVKGRFQVPEIRTMVAAMGKNTTVEK